MARTVYSLRIFSVHLAPGDTHTVTVPDEFVYVLRDIDAVLETPSGAQVLFVENPTLGFLWYTSVDPATQPRWQPWRGRQVYGPGEPITVTAQSGTWSVCASGYQLTLP